ncbi:MAG TPA: hypothetical protein VG796_02275 [Verrucomicrobiales bacterium]|jgi:hypothetical protein|nr:hypothetical protein [Verrucomicrobiales bacterium]
MDKETLPPETWDEHFQFALKAYNEDQDTGTLWPKLLRYLGRTYAHSDLQNEVFVSLSLAVKCCSDHCSQLKERRWIVAEENGDLVLHPAVIRALYALYALGDVYARIENPRVSFETLAEAVREHCPPQEVLP